MDGSRCALGKGCARVIAVVAVGNFALTDEAAESEVSAFSYAEGGEDALRRADLQHSRNSLVYNSFFFCALSVRILSCVACSPYASRRSGFFHLFAPGVEDAREKE